MYKQLPHNIISVIRQKKSSFFDTGVEKGGLQKVGYFVCKGMYVFYCTLSSACEFVS